MKLDAVLWDYGGTLVNSVPKNIDTTKNILADVAPHLTGDNLPRYLLSEADYHYANHAAKNWQAFYVDYYGMSQAKMLQGLGELCRASGDEQNCRSDGLAQLIATFSTVPLGSGLR